MTIDLLDIQWWQGLVGLIGLLGLSPAPWLLGLASGKIQFTNPATAVSEARVEELKAAHAIALEDQDRSHDLFTKELISHHEMVRNMDQSRYDDMKRSRDSYREAVKEQRERADKATETTARAVEAVEATNHLLESLAIVGQEVVSGE